MCGKYVTKDNTMYIEAWWCASHGISILDLKEDYIYEKVYYPKMISIIINNMGPVGFFKFNVAKVF